MKKQPKKKSRLQELDEKQQSLERKMFQAYSTNMSHAVIEQLQKHIEFNQMEIRDEAELERHRGSLGDGVSMSTDPDDRKDDDEL